MKIYYTIYETFQAPFLQREQNKNYPAKKKILKHDSSTAGFEGIFFICWV